MELERVQRALSESEDEMTRLMAETERLQESTVPLAEADNLREQLEEQKSKVKNMWRSNCEQISILSVVIKMMRFLY